MTSPNPHERHLAISGVLIPVTTPFDGDGKILPDRLAENLAKWMAVSVDGERITGFIVQGSTGEAPLCTPEERRVLVRTAREVIPRGTHLLVGTGAQATAETIARTREAAELGADGALVLTPSYFKEAMTEEALARYYLAVAEASPIPILLYNVPQFTGVLLGEAVARHLKAHPKIVGMKDSSGNAAQIGEICWNAPPDFHLLVGNATIFLAALAMGASGGMLALANVAPQIPLQILADFRAGRLDAARETQLESLALARAVPTRLGIAGLKVAMDMVGYYGGPVRPPLLPSTPACRHLLQSLLESLALV